MFQYLLSLDTEEEKGFFREIYEAYRDEMFYTAYVILENRWDAEEVLQEAFIAVLSNLDKLRGNTPQKNWNYIATLVKTRAYNCYKKRKRQAEREVPMTEEILESMVDEEFDRRIRQIEQRDFLVHLLRDMSETSRDVLLLRYYHELNSVEIGKLLGKSPDSVRHMIKRAKEKLQGMLEGQ